MVLIVLLFLKDLLLFVMLVTSCCPFLNNEAGAIGELTLSVLSNSI